MTLPQQVEETELWQDLISHLFPIQSGEQLIGVINVTKLNRRKGRDSEQRILCLTVHRQDAQAIQAIKKINALQLNAIGKQKQKASVRLLAVKKQGRNYEVVKMYKLKRLAKIEGFKEKSKEKEFILTFENTRPFHVNAEKLEQKNFFLCKLIQLAKENFGSIPVLEGINIEILSQFISTDEEEEEFTEELTDIAQKDLVTEEEQRIMRKILDQFNLDISDAKHVSSELQARLALTERENIHAILQKQDQWEGIIKQLDGAKTQLNEMGDWLDRYHQKLMLMQKDIEQIETENNNMEIQARNHEQLAVELERLSKKLEYKQDYVLRLKNEAFDTPDGLQKINEAVVVLQSAIQERLSEGMDHMQAVMQRNKHFQGLRYDLVTRFRVYLKKYLSKMPDRVLKERGKNVHYTIKGGTRLDMEYNINKEIAKFHQEKVHKDLLRFEKIMACTRSFQDLLDALTGHTTSTDIDDKSLLETLAEALKDKHGFPMHQLQNAYGVAMNSLYKKEFSDFTLDIKSAIKKNPANKSSNLFRLGSGKENEGTTVAANSKVRPASLRMNSPMMLSSKVPLNTGSRFSVASPISLKGLNIPQSPVNISVTKPSNTATDRSEEDSDASEEDSDKSDTDSKSEKSNTRSDRSIHKSEKSRHDEESDDNTEDDTWTSASNVNSTISANSAYIDDPSRHILQTNMGEFAHFVSDSKDRAVRVDTLFAQALNSVCDIIYQEQLFITKFFKLSDTPNNQGKSEIDLLLEKMFKEAQEHLNDLTEWVKKKTDRFLVLSTLMAADQVLVAYRDKSHFLTLLILDLQARLNKALNKFVEDQLESIREYKCVIKKVTLVPYVAKFPYFVDRFESIMGDYSEVKTTTRQTADTTYLKLTSDMFANLERMAITDEKHSNSFRMKNYYYFYNVIKKRLDQSVDYQRYTTNAEESFIKARASYVRWMIHWKFDELFKFIEGLEDTLRTVEAEDIVYQNQYSKTRVKDVITRYPRDVFEKGLVEILKRMDKHLGPKRDRDSTFKPPADYSSVELFDVIWNELKQEFLKKYENFENNVKKCYGNSGIVLSPSLSIVKKVFDTEFAEYQKTFTTKK